IETAEAAGLTKSLINNHAISLLIKIIAAKYFYPLTKIFFAKLFRGNFADHDCRHELNKSRYA
ncbi:hypothetical protein ABTL43_19920, partial [Acinetobacter baumannii]